MITLKRGDMVEFTDLYHQHYTLGDPKFARFAVAIGETDTIGRAKVMLADKSIITLEDWQIQAYAFIPAYDLGELEEIWESLHAEGWEEYD